ncbi:ankyrin repeat-containing domain protein [Aspergillus insuetus]
MSPLQIAALRGHQSTAVFLLETPLVQIDPDEINQLLWNVAQEGYVDVVKVLAGLKMVNINYINNNDASKRTALLIALYGRHLDTVHALLRSGRVDPSIPDATGGQPVDLAAAFGFKDLVVLLERAATELVAE